MKADLLYLTIMNLLNRGLPHGHVDATIVNNAVTSIQTINTMFWN
jgi:hypothetical protein